MFPKYPDDPFYQSFDDSARAHSNLPALYAFYLENPSSDESDIDHITYAIDLSNFHRNKPVGERTLISRTELKRK